MKVLVTGGHFSPALSIIKELQKKAEVIVVGRKNVFEGDRGEAFEYKVCKELNISFKEIKTGRLQRKFTKHTIPSIIKFPFGVIHAMLILKKIKPDVILTFGGYIGLPVSIAAFIFGKPIVIHEQTQKAGFSNKLISYFAKKVCISFESSKKFFPKNKVVLTGNPIREDVFTINKKIDVPRNFKIIYITGGSSGSHFINEIISKILHSLLENFVVIHQTGDSKVFNDYEKLDEIKNSLAPYLKEKYILKKFIYPDEIGWVLNNASLVISRSGMNTVCELLSLGKTSLLIPLPYAQGNEQLDNAKLIKEAGIGEYLEQKVINENVILYKINEMIKNEKNYKKNDVKAKKYIIKDANKEIVNIIFETLKKKH